MLVAVALLTGLSAVLGRLYYLHVYDEPRLARIVEHNRDNFQILHARRGSIMDMRGNLLATTQQVYDVGLDPHVVNLEEDQEKLSQLAMLLEIPLAEIFEKASHRTKLVDGPDGPELRDVRWQKLAESVDIGTYKAIRELKMDGVYGNIAYERQYPSGSLAAHLLGFVNKEDKAVTGVERMMDFYLRGQDGWRETERDGHRKELAQFRDREVEPRDGLNVELTIDSVIQHIVEEELKRIAEEYTPNGATIIVTEPSTGAILALGNYPTFDPNKFWESEMENQRNRAITDIYEPGSTFKIVPIAAALNEGLVRPSDIIDCSIDTAQYNGRDIRLPKDHHPYGKLTVSEVASKSSNKGAAQLGMRLGADMLYEYSHTFGFGEQTGLGLTGEVNGILNPVSRWDGLTISRLPMGHAVGATPMQVHSAMATIANDGVLVEPRIVRRVFDLNNESVVQFMPEPKRRVVSTDTARIVADMLVGVVGPEGTAGRAEIPGFQVAGKTGTTQKIIDGKYSSKHHVASFSGFFPASNPRVVITVVVDDPVLKGYGYGGVVSAPAFKNISEQLIQYLGIQPVDNDAGMLAYQGGNNDWLSTF